VPVQLSTLPGKNSDTGVAELASFWQRRKPFVLGALLVAATLLLYSPVTAHKFINLDDNHYVTENPHVTTGLRAENIRWAFHTFQMGNWNPVTWLSHMLDCQLYGLNPAGHHYTNALLHAANALLLFLLLAWATGATGCSFVVAALFAVHPLNVENVAWIAERKTLLCTLFFFLTLGAYGWYAQARSWGRYLPVLLFFVLSLMAKPMSVTLPVALLLIDYWPLQQLFGCSAATGPDRRAACGPVRLIVEKLPLFLVSLLFSGLAIVAQGSSNAVIEGIALPLRIQNAAVAYAAYIGKAFWPAHLSIFYPYPKGGFSWAVLGLSLLGLVAVTALCIWLRNQRYLAAGWLFFLVSLLPVIGLIQVGNQAMADRYAYTPLIGLFVMVVWGIDSLRARLHLSSKAAAAVAVCALAALGATSRTTLGYWQNSLMLFLHAQQGAKTPSELIETNLGKAYEGAGQPEEALRHYKMALSLNPASYMAHYNIGSYLLEHGRAAESISEFQAAIRYSASRWVTEYAQGNLGEAYLLTHDYARSEEAFAEALRLAPNSFVALIGHGQALLRLHRYEEADADFSRALRGGPRPELLYLKGMALEGQGRLELAREVYRQALQLAPQMTEAQNRLAALAQQAAH
jgi:Tfp pilus assembly protein PilF